MDKAHMQSTSISIPSATTAKPIVSIELDATVAGASRRRDRDLDPIGGGGAGGDDIDSWSWATRAIPAATYSRSFSSTGWLPHDKPESGFVHPRDLKDEHGTSENAQQRDGGAELHKNKGAEQDQSQRAKESALQQGQPLQKPPLQQKQPVTVASKSLLPPQRTASAPALKNSNEARAISQSKDSGKRKPAGRGSTIKWEEDSAVSACRSCNATFSMFLRKHHCRMCGRIFCNSCTKYKELHHNVSVRVCTGCFSIHSPCDTLPLNALVRIFQYISADDVNRLLAMRSVCRRWHTAVSDVRLWSAVSAGYFKDVRTYIGMYGRWHKGECEVQEYDLIGVQNWQCDPKSALIVGVNTAAFPPTIVGQDLACGRVLFQQACGGRAATWHEKSDLLLCGYRLIVLIFSPGQSLLHLYDWTPTVKKPDRNRLKLQQSKVLYVESTCTLIDFEYPWIVLGDGDTLRVYHFDTCQPVYHYYPETPADVVFESVDYVMQGNLIMSTEVFSREQADEIHVRVLDLNDYAAGHKVELTLDAEEATNVVWDVESRLCLVVQNNCLRMYSLDTGELLSTFQDAGNFGDNARYRRLHFQGTTAVLAVRESETAGEEGANSSSREGSWYAEGAAYSIFRMYILSFDKHTNKFRPLRELAPYEGTVHRVWVCPPLQVFLVFDMQDVYVYSLITGRDLYGMNEQEGALLTSFHADMKGIAVLQGRHVTYSRFALPPSGSNQSSCLVQ